jgi:glutathione S-transferase
MNELTLYVDSTYSSPWAMSVYLALVEKKLPFTVKTLDLDAGENKTGPFKDIGLTGRVPTLVDGDFVLAESSAIIDYLEEKYPAPDYPVVLPKSREKRAHAREVMAWIRSDNMAVRAERNTGVIFFKPIDTPLTPAGQAAATRFLAIADRLVSGPNLFGEWSVADADLALMLNRLIMNGDPVPQKLKDYAAAQWARPSIQRWMAQPR